MLWRRGKSYSQDLRERVLAASEAGSRVGEIATVFRVSVSYVSKVVSRLRNSGERSARPQRCHVPAKLAGLHEQIRAEVTARPDATLAELRSWLSQTHRVSVSEGVLHGTLARLDLTLKKSPCARQNRIVRTLRRRVRRGAKVNRGCRRAG
jgi:transposase